MKGIGCASARALPLLAAILLSANPGRASVPRTTIPDTSICLYWDAREIPWTPSDRGDPQLGFTRTRDGIRASFRTWEEIACSDVSFREMDPSPSRAVGWQRDEAPDDLIVFRERSCVEEGVVPTGDPCWLADDCGNAYDCWPYADGVIALTTTSYDPDSGELIDADIELNAAGFHFTTAEGPPCKPPDFDGCTATDLQNTVTHEIGHVLGLAHSDDPASTMSADAPQGDLTKRTLAPDDVQTICAMYPAGRPPVTCFAKFRLIPEGRSGTGCGGCAASGPSSPWLLLAGLAALRLLRRRDRRPPGA